MSEDHPRFKETLCEWRAFIIRVDSGIPSNILSLPIKRWRDFVNSEEAKDRRRTGVPTSLASHDMGLYTMIERGRKDAR